MLKALIFDVDGTLAETEEVHRIAFNSAFAEADRHIVWSRETYRELLAVTGGRERLDLFVAREGLDPSVYTKAVLDHIHRRKNDFYGSLVRSGDCPFRPGVEALIRAARLRGLRLAICSTTQRRNIEALIEANLGAGAIGWFAAIVSGEDVVQKKPDREAYLTALSRLGVEAPAALAFEDSTNGLQSALGAGITTVVTPCFYTEGEDFTGAAAVLPDLTGFPLGAWIAARG